MFQFATTSQSIGQVISAAFKLLYHTFTKTWYLLFGIILFVFAFFFFSPAHELQNSIINLDLMRAQNGLLMIKQQAVQLTFQQRVYYFLFTFFVLLFFYAFNVLVRRIKKLVDDPNTSLKSSLIFVLKKYWILLASLLLSVCIGMLGFFTLFVPWVFLFFTEVAILFDGKGIFSSIIESCSLVWMNFWRTFAVVLVPSLIIFYFLVFLSSSLLASKNIGLSIATGFSLLTVTYWVMKLLVIVQFYDLKIRKAEKLSSLSTIQTK